MKKSRWQYTIPANAFHDADGDSLSYSATQADGKPLPKWLNFNAANRTFSGTPGNDDVGNLALRITASDNRGGVASQNLALQIANVNDAPQIGTTIANHTSESGKPLQYRLPTNAFKDIDKGDVLTLSAKLENGQPLPRGCHLTGKRGNSAVSRHEPDRQILMLTVSLSLQQIRAVCRPDKTSRSASNRQRISHREWRLTCPCKKLMKNHAGNIPFLQMHSMMPMAIP